MCFDKILLTFFFLWMRAVFVKVLALEWILIDNIDYKKLNMFTLIVLSSSIRCFLCLLLWILIDSIG
ncbi:hypothetical protein RchiOBHm_Chr2g0109041 [Rosa chinensis]|uniref:Uncharacterized protein n=1 Tax=Rosa chinensis TaxID=74649 RepID=A0A2P6RPC0_ROSCH|nr:hypothetical protein RchiOBHm_Chr2g0109041 [Rosa chinensis]